MFYGKDIQSSIFRRSGKSSRAMALASAPSDKRKDTNFRASRTYILIAQDLSSNPRSSVAMLITSFLPHRVKVSGDALFSNIALYGAENIFELTDAGRSFPYSATEVALAPTQPTSYSPRSVFFSFFSLCRMPGNGNAPVEEVRLCGACVSVRGCREVNVVRDYIRQSAFLKATPQVAA